MEVKEYPLLKTKRTPAKSAHDHYRGFLKKETKGLTFAYTLYTLSVSTSGESPIRLRIKKAN